MIKNTQNPNWNFTALFPYSPQVTQVHIKCLDQERIQLLQRSEGTSTISLDQLIPNEGDKWEDWVSLTDGGQGMISVGLARYPVDFKFGSNSDAKTDQIAVQKSFSQV